MALTPCIQCNTEISEKAKVCPKCGQENPIVKRIQCTECENMVVPSNNGICPICGNPEFALESIPSSQSKNHPIQSTDSIDQSITVSHPANKNSSSFSIYQLIYYLGSFLTIAGGILAIIGIILFIGNITGALRSFSYAGGITLVIASITAALGKGIESLIIKKLLSDKRYQAALILLVKESGNMEEVFSYLVEQGIPLERAKREFYLVLLAIQAQANS